jgi:hypothetical protein
MTDEHDEDRKPTHIGWIILPVSIVIICVASIMFAWPIVNADGRSNAMGVIIFGPIVMVFALVAIAGILRNNWIIKQKLRFPETIWNNPYEVRVTMQHTVSIEQRQFSNKREVTTTYRQFDVFIKPVDSLPKSRQITKWITCPYCHARLSLIYSQEPAVFVTPSDLSSKHYGKRLRCAYVRRQSLLQGMLVEVMAILPMFFIDIYFTPFPSIVTVNIILVIIGCFAVGGITSSILAFANRKFPMGALRQTASRRSGSEQTDAPQIGPVLTEDGGKTPASKQLFVASGPRSILWRELDHNRFFNIITDCKIGVGWLHKVGGIYTSGDSDPVRQISENYHLSIERYFSL